jgi:hypothetical protein
LGLAPNSLDLLTADNRPLIAVSGNPKFQIPNPKQIPNSKFQIPNLIWNLKPETWNAREARSFSC